MMFLLHLLAFALGIYGTFMLVPGLKLRHSGPIVAGLVVIAFAFFAVVLATWWLLLIGFLSPMVVRAIVGDPSLSMPVLHQAVIRYDIAAVRALLKSGVAVNEKNERGETPLDIALRLSHQELIALIRKRGGQTSVGIGKDSVRPHKISSNIVPQWHQTKHEQSELADASERELVIKLKDIKGVEFARVDDQRRLIVSPGVFSRLRLVVLLNARCAIAGCMRVRNDGKIEFLPHERNTADLVTALMHTLHVVATNLPAATRAEFCAWSGLSRDEWTPEHCQLFIMTYMQCLQQAAHRNVNLSETEAAAAPVLYNAILPTLTVELTPEIKSLFHSLT